MRPIMIRPLNLLPHPTPPIHELLSAFIISARFIVCYPRVTAYRIRRKLFVGIIMGNKEASLLRFIRVSFWLWLMTAGDHGRPHGVLVSIFGLQRFSLRSQGACTSLEESGEASLRSYDFQHFSGLGTAFDSPSSPATLHVGRFRISIDLLQPIQF